MIETEDDSLAPTTDSFGPGHDVWQRTSSGHFKYAFLIHQYDGNGNLVAIERDDATITLDSDGRFEGTAHFTIVDSGGNELLTGDALLSAKSFELNSSN